MIRNTLISAVSMLAVAGVANAATVQINPSSNLVATGDSFTVTVEGVDFPEVTGGGFIISWDAGLEVLSTDAQMAASIVSHGWDFGGVNSSTAGQLDIGPTMFFGSRCGPGPALCDFNIVTIEFQANFVGGPPRDLNLFVSAVQPNWVGPGNIPLDPQPNYIGATVTVGAVPLPATAWLFGSGLLGMVGIARRRRS